MNYLVAIPQCSSTNDEVLNHFPRWKEKGDSITLYTFNQTQGRGQYGNAWLSFPQQNLAFSMAFLTEEVALPHHLFNFHTANVLREFIAKKTDAEIQVKWPNDIIISGKKVSGMLIEKKFWERKEFFIVGIGVNILQKDFSHLPKAGSVLTQTSLIFDLVDWAEEMHQFFVQHLFEKVSEEKVLEKYNAFLFKKEKVSTFEIGGMRQNGIIKYADEQGFLWVELEKNGLKKFYHKELELLY